MALSKIYDAIMTASKQSRLARNAVGNKTLTPLLADVQRIGKDAQREPTDLDCLSVLKSTIKNVRFNIEHTEGVLKEEAQAELVLLQQFLPAEPDAAEVTAEIERLKAEGLNKGLIIKGLKTKFGAALDVSEIAKSL